MLTELGKFHVALTGLVVLGLAVLCCVACGFNPFGWALGGVMDLARAIGGAG